MRRGGSLLFAALTCMCAQTSRDSYRTAFQAWRQADPSLERDAATAGTALGPRANKAVAAEAAFATARSAALRATSEDAEQALLWLRQTVIHTPPELTPSEDLQKYVSGQNQAVAATINAYAKDTDRGIQQLRQSLEREQAALAALSVAIAEREKTANKAAQAVKDLEQTRVATADRYSKTVDGLARSVLSIDQENMEWATYYQLLAEGARTAAVVSAVPSPAPVLTPAPEAAAPPRGTSITGLSINRYVGDWVLPENNPVFHGPQPELVDFTAEENKGRVTGKLYVRFKLAGRSTENPELRFEFAGELRPGQVQTFPLTTSDGAKGTIDLIPGTAFNLLEINFLTDPTPGKIRAGNFILVKK